MGGAVLGMWAPIPGDGKEAGGPAVFGVAALFRGCHPPNGAVRVWRRADVGKQPPWPRQVD